MVLLPCLTSDSYRQHQSLLAFTKRDEIASEMHIGAFSLHCVFHVASVLNCFLLFCFLSGDDHSRSEVDLTGLSLCIQHIYTYIHEYIYKYFVLIHTSFLTFLVLIHYILL